MMYIIMGDIIVETVHDNNAGTIVLFVHLLLGWR